MALNQIGIWHFKSIANLKIESLNNFMVFFGSNSSGKSNIFEAIEIASLIYSEDKNAFDFIPNFSDTISMHSPEEQFKFMLGPHTNNKLRIDFKSMFERSFETSDNLNKQDSEFFKNFSRIFINNASLVKKGLKGENKLSLDCSNLESVLKRVLKNSQKSEEIMELLRLLIPGFEMLDIKVDTETNKDVLHVYEKSSHKSFKRNLISDGTFNIICLLTLLFQSDSPQFICIEEPENGLNPKVVSELVNIFRDRCEENGDFIWLNTHSQTLVSELKPKEAVIVEKKDGITGITELKDVNTYELKMDTAWLTNYFGKGLPW